jgi:hypothetical protein
MSEQSFGEQSQRSLSQPSYRRTQVGWRLDPRVVVQVSAIARERRVLPGRLVSEILEAALWSQGRAVSAEELKARVALVQLERWRQATR